MFYLIQTPYHSRPYLTSVAFLARDFGSWGCRVDNFADHSPYIAEIRRRERRINRTSWRIKLMEHWSRETIYRRQQERQRGYHIQTIAPMAQSHSIAEDTRLERSSSMMQDFVDGVAAFGGSESVYTVGSKDPRPLPIGPAGLVCRYTRSLEVMRYTSNAPLPSWSTPDFFLVDQISLEFRVNEVFKKKHFTEALEKAICKNVGRMGKVERDLGSGVCRVTMFVEVSDLLTPRDQCMEDKVDPLPLYEQVERPPAYVSVS